MRLTASLQHERIHAVAIGAVVAFVLVAGCSSPDQQVTNARTADSDPSSGTPAATVTDPPLDKAGRNSTSSDPITLTLAWYGGQGRPQAMVAERFAEEVATASNGAIRIEITFGMGDRWLSEYQAGNYDMALSPTRSLDTLGVTTFDALTVPFVVSDDEQADRVASAPVVDTMMNGLSVVESTGLMFAPVYEMHLSTPAGSPLRTLDQLRGGMRIAPPSNRLEQIYDALGAVPLYGLDNDDWYNAVADGEVVASEFPLALAPGMPTPEMAANFTMFYEFVVLMIHDDKLGDLDAGQVEILRAAAQRAEDRSIAERIREPQMFEDVCAEGAVLTAAPMSFVADLGRATDDVILGMLEDAETKALYDAVKRAAGARAETWPRECHNGAITRYEPPAPPSLTFPEGIYRLRGRTREEMVVSGVSNDVAAGNESDYIEVTFRNGTALWDFHYPADYAGQQEPQCSGPYTVESGLIVSTGCGWDGTYTWHPTEDGITLELMPTDDRFALWGAWDNSAIGLSDLVRVD